MGQVDDVDLKQFRENFESSWNSIKEFKHGEDKTRGWKMYNALINFEEVKAMARE